MSSIVPTFLAELPQRQVAQVALVYGLACDVSHSDRTLRVDLPRAAGGGATGPHPGQLLRASIGACLVMGCVLWARKLGVAIDDVQLELACTYDERGQLGLDASVAVGWQRLELDLLVTSAAAPSEVERVVETARRLSPMLQNLSPAIEQVFRLRVISPSFLNETKGPRP